jgi:hypothetical protein
VDECEDKIRTQLSVRTDQGDSHGKKTAGERRPRPSEIMSFRIYT